MGVVIVATAQSALFSLDGDGYPDVVVANRLANTLNVLLSLCR